MIIQCRFFGGPWDGEVHGLSETLLTGSGVIRVPEPLDPSTAIAEPTIHMTELNIHTYTWDLTLNDAGERRMRWDGPPR